EGDRVKTTTGPLKFEGHVTNGKLEMKTAGKDGPSGTMAASVTGNEMSGEFHVGDMKGTWKAMRPAVRPANAPREHVFEPKEFHRMFSGSIQPVLRIYPGDTVKTWSVDAGGVDAKGVRRSLGGNPETGPFYIEGALPGDTLA